MVYNLKVSPHYWQMSSQHCWLILLHTVLFYNIGLKQAKSVEKEVVSMLLSKRFILKIKVCMEQFFRFKLGLKFVTFVLCTNDQNLVHSWYYFIDELRISTTLFLFLTRNKSKSTSCKLIRGPTNQYVRALYTAEQGRSKIILK